MQVNAPYLASALSSVATDAPAQAIGPDVRLKERRDIGMLLLRGKMENSSFVAAFERLLGIAPPTDQYVVHSEPFSISRMGPTDFLLTGPLGAVDALAAEAEAAAMDAPFLVANIGHGRVVVDVEGRHASDVLSKFCGLDLRDAAFPGQSCTRTRFAGMLVYMERLEEDVFRLVADRSLGLYLWSWLHDASEINDVTKRRQG